MNIKKLIITNLPYAVLGLVCTNLGEAWRIASGSDASEKILSLFGTLPAAFGNPMPSLNALDLCVGLVCGLLLRLVVYLRGKNAKKYRHGYEYGAARWGTAEDIRTYVDPVFKNNIILTQTERLTMNSRPKDPKTARNKNVLIVGGSGSGKTRFFIKPNIMQLHSSYVVTDPKGQLVLETGRLLERAGFEIRVLNTINFKKSMRYDDYKIFRPTERKRCSMTNTNMEIFNSEEFGTVRVLTLDGEPWFVGRDVASALGYANTKDALGKHVDQEDKRIIQRSSGATFEIPVRGLTIINESGLYSLMLSCRLASGKRFKRWITSEVLPTIRKNGFYITDPLLQQFARDPDFAHAVVDALYEQTERVNRLLPKADYFDAFVDPGDAVPIRIAAKQLGVSEQWLVRLLVGCRMLYRCNGRLVPYADKRFRGLFAVKERRTMVTPLGKQVLHDFIGMLTSDEKAAV